MLITDNKSQYRTAYALQCTSRNDSELHLQLAALKKVDGYSFGLIPFSNEITGIESIPNDRPIVPLAGTKLISMHNQGLTPDNWVVFYDEVAFAQDTYQPILGMELLNNAAQVMSLQEALDYGTFDETVFIKPSNDLKMFAGTVIDYGQSLQEVLDKMQHQPLVMDDLVIVAPWRPLHREFRVIVVDGVPAGFSQYKDDKLKVQARSLTLVDRDRLYFKALELHNHWHPAPVYTIDFAEVGPKRVLKVVEYNCFNASGLYKIDRARVYEDIAKYVDRHF